MQSAEDKKLFAELKEIKERAHRDGVSLTSLVNRLIRQGLEVPQETRGKPSRPYREQVFSLGPPRVELDRALALAAALEDEEVAEEMVRRK